MLQSEQTRNRMRHLAVFALGVCLSATSVARADISAGSTRSPEQAKNEVEFRQLAEMAEKARLSGRYNDAALLYSKALELQRDPIALGRFGLVLMKLGQLAHAGELLHDALEHGQGVSARERREVTDAYDKAKSLTTWVNVNVSQAGAKITYDGEPQNRGGYSAFWMFTMPGEHTLRAKLDGYEDAVVTFTGKAGEEIAISLNLVPVEGLKWPEISAAIETNQNETRTFPPYLRASNIADDPNYSPKEDPFYGEPKDSKPIKKKSGTRVSVTGGVVTVFGVASWNPAVGPVIGVSVKPKEFLSLGLEGRAAWLTTDVVTNAQINAMTAGGVISACGHLKWFFGCGIGFIGGLNIKFSEESYTGRSSTDLKVGGGGRVGARIQAADSFFVTGSVDVLKLSRGTRVAVNNTVIADIEPIMVGGQIIGEWEF